jgi:hypothetical protein
MLGRLAAALAVLVLLLRPAGAAEEDAHRAPSWLKSEPSKKLVRLDIVAGFNANNGALNFNGYYSGDMTVIVPVGWTVEIRFKNNDAMLPHSLLVTKPYAQGHFPEIAGVDSVAIPRAYTDNPDQGIFSPKTDQVSFVAKEPGDFLFFCGAPGHGLGGMWTKLKIDPAASAPSVSLASGAEPGRP